MPDLQSIINSEFQDNEQQRTLMQAFYDQLTTVNQSTGNNWLDPTSGAQKPSTLPPTAGSLSVSGANGTYVVAITNASQGGVNATIYNQVAYSPIQSFGQNITTLPTGTGTHYTVPNPGQQLFFRVRWSFDQATWSSWVTGTATVASMLQSSAATENSVALNISNYAYVDSVDAGATANVRVYGAAGPYNGFINAKGTVETPAPSATIVNVAKSTTQLVAFDGDQYRVAATLPGVFSDTWRPVGQVSVVGSGTPTLPVIVLNVQNGYVVGIKSTSTFGTGLTQLPTFTITDSSGTGASIIATGINAGAITGIQVINGGDGNYSSTPTATAHGGVFSGSTGGGTAAGGNGGRLTAI